MRDSTQDPRSDQQGEDDAPGDQIALSALQLDLMRVLWQHGEASVADVVAALADTRDLAHTTVATLLTRLARRGVVEADRDGRQLLYRPLVSERQVRRGMVAEIVRTLFSGSSGALLAHLVSEREVAADDLARVQALLQQTEHDDD
jgi:BlaI family transcriptional regulator, penicillinase repressor